MIIKDHNLATNGFSSNSVWEVGISFLCTECESNLGKLGFVIAILSNLRRDDPELRNDQLQIYLKYITTHISNKRYNLTNTLIMRNCTAVVP